MIDLHDKTLIFLHMPKAAGQTVSRILFNIYGQGTPTVMRSLRCVRKLPVEQRCQIQLFTGHVPFGAHTEFPRSVIYLTMLREPVDRVLSGYYFIRRKPDHYLYPWVRRRSVKQFCQRKGAEQHVANIQTKILSGFYNVVRGTAGRPINTRGVRIKPEFANAHPSDVLESAKLNLSNWFVFGITTRFDDSIRLFRRIFGWPEISYKAINVTPSRPRVEHHTENTLDVIRNCNTLDIELYRYARKLFKARIREEV